jgi:Sap, sulfolipid-1-addressing protein
LGWLIGLAVAGGILRALASGNAQEDGDEPATWVSVVKLLFGILFVLIAARTWRGRPREGDEAAMPKWMQAIDRFGAGKAFGMGCSSPPANNATILTVLLLLLGAKLIGDGISGLSS